MEDENHCFYLSSRGLLKSCHVHSTNPISSIRQLIGYDLSKLYDGCSLYICNAAIPWFSKMLPQINCQFLLVSGDCDESCPTDLFRTNDEFVSFIENPKIIHWYSQNCIVKHEKITQLPIGLDYHTLSKTNHPWGNMALPVEQEHLLTNIKHNSKPFWERELKCYSNFHFAMKTKFSYDRKDAYENIDKELVYYEPTQVKRYISWKKQTSYAFVLSPHGNGLDCHRTWEALCLGCIPIVKTSPLDNMYDGLPVLVVNDWKDITIELLQNTVDNYKDRPFIYEKLSLSYWMNKIHSSGTS